MSEPTAPSHDSRPWRKRRPILSRIVLYALGGLLAAILVILWSQRSAEDEAARIAILRARVRGMPSTLISIPGGQDEIKRLLATDDFTDPDLPDDVKSLVERTRALALRVDFQDPERVMDATRGVDAALKLAEQLAPAEEVQAIRLEWAEARLETGTTDGVDAMLTDPLVRWTQVSTRIIRAYLRAAVLVENGDRTGATQHLDDFLGSLAAPLSTEETIEIGGRPWSASQAAVMATGKLASIRAGQDDPRIWQRLAALAPNLCLAQVRAASALASMGRTELALSIWQRALVVDASEARLLAERDPIMGPLKKLLAESSSSLKSPSPDGR